MALRLATALLPSAAATVLLLTSGPAVAEEADRILLDSLAPHTVPYEGEQVTEVRGSGRPPLQQKVYRSATRLRIEFPGGQVVLDDGTSQLRYFPRLAIVERGPSDLNNPRSRFVRNALASGRATASRLPDDTVAARSAYVIVLRSSRMRRPPRTIWIDKEHSIQLRQDVEQPGGQVRSTYFTRIRFGAEPLAARMQPTWPASTPVFPRGPGRPLPLAEAEEVARAWGGLLVPKTVPPGFRLRGYYLHERAERTRVLAVYDDAASGRTLTVAQFAASALAGPSAKGSGEPSGRAKKDAVVVTDRKGAASLTATGPLPEAQLRQLLASMQ